MTETAPVASDAPAPRTRKRLPPDIRIGQLLDAAQAVFEEHGYAATRIDDIALRAGLSKGGVYAHFVSKEAIFEALMRRALTPPTFLDMPAVGDDDDLTTLASWLVDRLHSVFATPSAVAAFRLIVAERERFPHLLALWQREILQPNQQALSAALQTRLAGRLEPATYPPWLLVAPVVYVMVMRTLFGEQGARPQAEFRADHIALVCRLLAPAPAHPRP